MALYRSKPKTVEATQWFPGVEIAGVKRFDPHGNAIMRVAWYVTTFHGQTIWLAPGDWVVTEPDGVHHQPVKDDIFRSSYHVDD